jgi:hypothetical protein
MSFNTIYTNTLILYILIYTYIHIYIFNYTSKHIQHTGYDPREAKPTLLESHYQGGVAPLKPLLKLPTQVKPCPKYCLFNVFWYYLSVF